MFPFQIDPDLSLELLAPRHAEELFALVDANREHLKPWMPWVASTNSPDDTRAFIAQTLKQVADNSGFQTAVCSGGKIVGVVGMHAVNWSHKQTSLGYWLDQNAQGRGFMTRSCRAYLDHIFGDLGLHRVEIRCATGNARSRAVAERLGFQLEGVIRDVERVNGVFVDHQVYGLLAAEWEERRGNRPTPA